MEERLKEVQLAEIITCRCDRFSCESVTIKTETGDFSIDSTSRFRFVKDEDGCITNRTEVDGVEYRGGHTSNSILDCELRGRSSCVVFCKNDSGERYSIKIEQISEQGNGYEKKGRKKKRKKKKGKWMNVE